MLEFDHSYFEQEERDGFVIESMMKRAWAAEQQVLSEVVRICQRHDITYYADYGTMLGAVRHGGFIPWDDDIDIALKRTDYQRLFELLSKELPPGYVANSCYTQPDHGQPWGSVTNGIYVEDGIESRKQKFYGCPYVVGIDIYPLDYIPSDPQMAETQLNLYSALYDAAQRYEELVASGEMEQLLPQLEELCRYQIDRTQPVPGQLWKLADQVAGLFTEEDGEELTLMARMAQGDQAYRLPKSWYAGTVTMPFEQLQIEVPVGYSQILAKMYGEDYMTPVRSEGAHEYPFYKKQMENLFHMLRK